jgi:uncharacterized membrane protein
MNKRLSPLTLIFILTLSMSAISFYLLWSEVSSITETNLTVVFPMDRIQVLIFLAKPLLLLAPFLLILTIIGAYSLSKIWLKDVVINIVNEAYDKKFIVNKTKYLSDEEKEVFKLLVIHRSEALQSDLVKESNLSGYKVTRILNRFERSGLIRREKYGITNVIFLLFDPDSQETL